jgi:uncharacterized membrane-anchored protein
MRFALACAVQVLVIAAVALAGLTVLATGADVLLRIEPVDPRDPLRGDHVTFQYAISRLDASLFRGVIPHRGAEVFVVIAPRGRTWEAVAADTRPPRDPGAVFVRGRAISTPAPQRPGAVHVTYGIEEYFIPEGRGSGFDFRRHDVVGQVAVDGRGRSVLRQLYVDGRPWP